APRPANDRFEVKAGEEVPLCLKLEAKGSPLIKRIQEEATAFRLILEDSQEPPNAMTVRVGDEKKPLKPDAQGCYRGFFVIPPQVNEGVYQVANLLFRTRRRNYVGLQQVLYNFSKADELKVENPNADNEAPKLIGISSFQKSLGKLDGVGNFEDIKVKQNFTFDKEGSGVEPKSLKVYYALIEEGQQVSIHQAECKRIRRRDWNFQCKLHLLRPDWQWEASHVSLVLQSIYVKDKAGNLLVLQEPAVLKEAAKDTPIRFDFRPDVDKVTYKNYYQRHPQSLAPRELIKK
ncbi:MAG: hypothetical protein R3257_07340, partial [bacterium]|nr:hypothetical protein [bacterium]